MNTDSPLKLIMERFEEMVAERDAHLQEAARINEKLLSIAVQLGIDDPTSVIGEKVVPNRLPKEDKRSEGTMSAAMLELLYAADRGYNRRELRELVEETPKFKEQLDRNTNSFYNNVSRFLKAGKIVEIDGLLYHVDRAPLPEGEDDPSGQHLSNVATLFGPHREGQG